MASKTVTFHANATSIPSVDLIQNTLAKTESILYSITASVAIILNTIYIALMTCCRGRRSEDNSVSILAVSLSIANFLSACSIFYIYSMLLVGREIHVLQNIFLICCGATWQYSILTGMSLDRYLAILKPLHYHQLVNKTRVATATIISGVMSITLTCPLLVLPINFDQVGNNSVQTSNLTMSDILSSEMEYFFMAWSVLQTLFIIIISALSIPVILVIRKQLKKNDRNGGGSIKGTVMILIVILYSVITIIPLLFLFSLPSIREMPVLERKPLDMFCSIMLYSNGIVNPFLCGLASKRVWQNVCKKKVDVDIATSLSSRVSDECNATM